MQSHHQNSSSVTLSSDEMMSDSISSTEASSLILESSTSATTYPGSDDFSRTSDLAKAANSTAPASPLAQQQIGFPVGDGAVDLTWLYQPKLGHAGNLKALASPIAQQQSGLPTGDGTVDPAWLHQNTTSEAYRRRAFQQSLHYEQPVDSPQRILWGLPTANTDHTIVDPRDLTLTQTEIKEAVADVPRERQLAATPFAEALAIVAMTPAMALGDWDRQKMEWFGGAPYEQNRERNQTIGTPQSIAKVNEVQASTSSPASHRHDLPDSIYDYGFKPEDFDPTMNLTSQKSNIASFKPFPPDLADKHIFNANPKHIAYDNILRLATRYTSSRILEKINGGRPHEVLTRTAVDNRIRSALKLKAEKAGTVGGFEVQQLWLEQERAKNGIETKKRSPGKKRARSDDEISKADTALSLVGNSSSIESKRLRLE